MEQAGVSSEIKVHHEEQRRDSSENRWLPRRRSQALTMLLVPFVAFFITASALPLIAPAFNDGSDALVVVVSLLMAAPILSFPSALVGLFVVLSAEPQPEEDCLTRREKQELSHGFNVGALLFGWVWGVANGVKKSLWTLVPVVNVVYIFILAAKGNEWAVESRNWRSAEEFKSFQSQWVKWAIMVFILMTLFGLLM